MPSPCRLLLAAVAMATASVAVPAAAPTPCTPSAIPNSNRSAAVPCTGVLGDVCEFQCAAGFRRRGRHVCQTYATHGTLVYNHTFAGGSCVRLCTHTPANCAPPGVPLRFNATDGAGPCLATRCFPTTDAALAHVAESAVRVWLRGRYNTTGLHLDHVSVLSPAGSFPPDTQSHVGSTGIGLVVDAVAHALNWTTPAAALNRTLQTLASLAGDTPGVAVARSAEGWLPTFVNASTGRLLRPATADTTYSTLATGLNTAGVLFARTYWQAVAPHTPAAAAIVALADRLYAAVAWDTLLCNRQGVVDAASGTGLPMLRYNNASCGATSFPEADGYYQFFEMHYTAWLAYHAVCNATACRHPAYGAMWSAWQGRRLHPNQHYAGLPLLSMWSCYVVHLPYYMTHSFNNDSAYLSLLHTHWQADAAFYASPAEGSAGGDGRYGLGAGPTERWCSGGTTYVADRLDANPGCRMFSPYCVAGYLPTAPSTVTRHLLALLADGETVLPVAGTAWHVLWRKSLLDAAWQQGYGITSVDFASEVLSLATLLLPPDFFQTYTRHFP